MKTLFISSLGFLFGISLGYYLYSFVYSTANTIYCGEHGKYVVRDTISKKYAIMVPYSGGSMVSAMARVPDDYTELSIINGTNYGIKLFCTDKTGKIVGDWHQAAPKQIMALNNDWCEWVLRNK